MISAIEPCRDRTFPRICRFVVSEISRLALRICYAFRFKAFKGKIMRTQRGAYSKTSLITAFITAVLAYLLEFGVEQLEVDGVIQELCVATDHFSVEVALHARESLLDSIRGRSEVVPLRDATHIASELEMLPAKRADDLLRRRRRGRETQGHPGRHGHDTRFGLYTERDVDGVCPDTVCPDTGCPPD